MTRDQKIQLNEELRAAFKLYSERNTLSPDGLAFVSSKRLILWGLEDHLPVKVTHCTDEMVRYLNQHLTDGRNVNMRAPREIHSTQANTKQSSKHPR